MLATTQTPIAMVQGILKQPKYLPQHTIILPVNNV